MQTFLNFQDMSCDTVNAFLNDYKLAITTLNDNLAQLDNENLSWTLFVQPQIDIDTQFASQFSYLQMDSFHPNKDIRNTCNNVSTEFQKFQIDQNMRKDVFQKFKYYYENQYLTEKELMSDEHQRYIEDCNKTYLTDGLNLDDQHFNKVKEIKKEMSDLSSKFDLNLANDTTSFELTLEELHGLQENWLTQRLQSNGLYKVNLSYPDFVPIIEYCTVRETRKKLAIAFGSKCANENPTLCAQTIKLRHELAEIFEFDSFADYSLQKKMAKNSQTVLEFLNDLKDKVSSALNADYEKLYKLASVDGITQLETFDIQFYTRLYKETLTKLDLNALRQYFNLEDVTDGIFQIYQTFLSLQITEITDQHSTLLWHSDVKLYQVNDLESGNLMGHFYLDLFPREGKYTHAAVFPFVRKSSSTLPLCAMACNFTTGNGLTHDEVVTYFHEFGHVMHNMCSNTTLMHFGGTACARDYVEVPSQCFERWCYAFEPLQILSNGKITNDVVEKLNQQYKLFQGYFYSKQLVYALTDMNLHSISWNIEPDTVYRQVHQQVLNISPPIETRTMGTFGHIMHGYAAGYYGYLWSESYCEDIYRTCIEGMELNPKIGLEYRREILSYGGSRDEMIGLVNMLKRYPNNEAFVKSILG